jgi:uncharacterized protein YkwD
MHRRPARRLPFARMTLVAAVAALALSGLGPVAHPAPAAAATLNEIATQVLGMINAERTKRGLVPLRAHPGLQTIANDRAAYMAQHQELKHPSCVSCMFKNAGIQYYSGTEVIAWTGWSPSSGNAAQSLFSAWRNSSLHWSILMSSKYNYFGIAAGYKSGGYGTYMAGEITESKDRTKPWAKMTGTSRSGTTVKWTWKGADTKLQTHTSGLKNFDVQYKVDGGTWKTIRSGTTAKSLTLYSRARGHCYYLRVRSRDNRLYVSSYTASLKVCVP